jgi:hypothetical protein
MPLWDIPIFDIAVIIVAALVFFVIGAGGGKING